MKTYRKESKKRELYVHVPVLQRGCGFYRSWSTCSNLIQSWWIDEGVDKGYYRGQGYWFFENCTRCMNKHE